MAINNSVKIALITVVSGIGGAIPGAVVGVAAGVEYVKRAYIKDKIKAFNTSSKVIFPTCIVVGAVIGGTIGYFLSNDDDATEDDTTKDGVTDDGVTDDGVTE